MNQRRIRAVVKVTSRKISPRRTKNEKSADKTTTDPASIASYKSYLQQAEVCREQAHDAVRLKRWKAATGLFATAVALCNRAVTLGGDACIEAKESLRQMQSEMAAYSELARSMEKPLLATPIMPSLSTDKKADAPPGMV